MAMSEFGKAFASARKAGDKTFMFKGKKYTTETKEEKEARMAKAKPKAAPKKDMPPAERAGTTKSQAAPEKKMPEAKPRVAAKPERKPIRMEGLERARKGISSIMASRQRRLDMEEADRKSRGDKYGMGMKEGGMVKKGRDGMATKGKTKGRMC